MRKPVSGFWRSIIYVMLKVGVLRPYVVMVDFLLDRYCGID